MKIIKFPILKTKKKKSRKNTFVLPFLPNPILAEILSRVPARTLFSCMNVSKQWLSLIDNSVFKRQHFYISRSKICPLLVFDTVYSPYKQNPFIFHLVEGESVADFLGFSCKLSSRIEMCRNVDGMNDLVLMYNSKATSCEGLVCSAPRQSVDGGRDHVVICNPITKEYLRVYMFKGASECRSVFIGLGFSRTDNVFRLLMVSKCVDGSEWFLETCEVGTRNWRRVEVGSGGVVEFMREVSNVVYVEGVMYWSYSGDVFICSFDFDVNEFRVVLLPLMTNGEALEANSFVTENVCLGVLESSLCVSMVCPYNGHVELWMIEKDGGRTKWRKVMDVGGHSFCRRGDYKVMKYFECGKILLHDWWGTFLVYDPVMKTEELVCVLDKSYLNILGSRINFQAVPHVPSLVSLCDVINIEDEECAVLKDH